MEQTASKVIFRGRVQGVGFRYTTCRIAGKYDLTGFVRNCPDGTVEAHLQGTAHAVEMCLKDIQNQFGSSVRDVTADQVPVNPRYQSFEIRY